MIVFRSLLILTETKAKADASAPATRCATARCQRAAICSSPVPIPRHQPPVCSLDTLGSHRPVTDNHVQESSHRTLTLTAWHPPACTTSHLHAAHLRTRARTLSRPRTRKRPPANVPPANFPPAAHQPQAGWLFFYINLFVFHPQVH
jgi:hypothetical protein